MRIRSEFLIVAFFIAALFAISYYEPKPIKQLMDWRASLSALAENKITLSDYQVFDHTDGKGSQLTVDFLKGKHFWHPQVAIWLEDSLGNHLETLLVTTSTAHGLFYSGRSAENFRETDEAKTEQNIPTRRVDALPYWSHKRGHQYKDGFYSPPPDDPMPDAVTGSTPSKSFYFKSATDSWKDLTGFRILVEVNVGSDVGKCGQAMISPL